MSRLRAEVAGMEFAQRHLSMRKDLGPMFDQALGENTLVCSMCRCVHVEVTWSC